MIETTKYTQSFRAIIASGRVEPLALPARSPNLNAYAALGQVGEGGVLSMPSGIIKVRVMSCCSLGVRTFAATGLFNPASDWADSCVITIKRQHERGGRLR